MTVGPADHPTESFPLPADRAQLALAWTRWREAAERTADRDLAAAMLAACSGRARPFLDAVFGNSPYLTSLALRDPRIVVAVLSQGPTDTLAELLAGLNREDPRQPRAALMARLRVAKRHAALVIGMADIAGAWTLEQVTGALSDLADAAVSAALAHLVAEAGDAGRIEADDRLERSAGIFVLGMGKLGARELNYSSDIDLIILFDGDRLRYRGRDSAQGFVTKLARDLVRIMEDRTVDGYVFRTDLRLRPDPRSTPIAVSVAAAETYYATVGQNWERAALIKARVIAGDRVAGDAFLRMLTPFLWRKHLDFAAIQDIHSIKRQIDARHGGPPETLAGYNVKLGYGGIREIELFAQTQQLIWGGRLPSLRRSETVETLRGLAATARIEAATAEELVEAYRYLRRLEHRLQMIDDKQTHSLPTDPAALDRVAMFLGYPDTQQFGEALKSRLDTVRVRFRALFPDAPPLSAEGNLVFTGKESDPETLATLERLGFRETERIAESIRGWHHGRYRATRSARARELLTELIPGMLRRFGKTPDPDLAFTRFDEFLGRLPAGVQLLSLFQRNPQLLTLVAEIMGESPLLAAQLARRPVLLDAVITGGFFASLPQDDATALAELRADLDFALQQASSYEGLLDLARRWANDRRFQIGVLLLQRKLDGDRAARDFSLVAEATVASLLPAARAEFARNHGIVERGSFAVLALGKLGSREMNVLSDLDLIFVYDAADPAAMSSGPRPLPVSTYFARLGQRVINALSAPTAEGGLYAVDMRLRPAGNAGPIASSLEAFRRYYADQAWTWERMALTRARVIAGDEALVAAVRAEVERILTRPSDPPTLLGDVIEMRGRIERAHPNPKPWDCKHRRGALVDLEFVAQYLMLRHAPDDPSLLCWQTAGAFRNLAAAGWLDRDLAASCLKALGFWQRLQQGLRVLLGKVESAEVAPDVLALALASTGESTGLDRAAETGMTVFERVIGARAGDHESAAQPRAIPGTRS